MALVTTAGAVNADSYASLADATAYFTNRGIAEWTGTDTVKENALRRATTYLDNQYRGRWVGVRVTETQALAWPRADGYRAWTTPLLDSDGFDIATNTIPTRVRDACLEAALLVVTGVTLEPRLERGGRVLSKTETIGPINESTTWESGSSAFDRLTVIEGLLRGLVKSVPGGSAGNVSLVRA